MNLKKVLLTTSLLLLLTSCGLVDPKIEPDMLDSDDVCAPAACEDNSYFLISDSLPNPGDSLNQIPVIVAAHGFTATTYEWQEFRNYCDSLNDLYQNPDSTVLVSQVLLGGHGLDYDAFKNSTWQEWQAPIMQEYRALAAAGYENLSLAGSSLGGTLILEMLASGDFAGLPAPRQIFMVDVIIVPGNKLLTLVDIVGPIIGNSILEGTEEEKANWYTNRPAEALAELMEVMNKVRKQLEKGLTLPAGTRMTIYTSKYDGTADPVSSLLIYKGVRDSEGRTADVETFDSRKHVFTRLAGRDSTSITELDWQNQAYAFEQMRGKVLGN
jgi:carboxylesterase